MKSRIFIALSFLICSIGLNFFSYESDDAASYFKFSNIEALANGGESTGYIRCYCALMSDNNCAVNNNGSSVCASGDNVKCWEYDGNCN